MSASSFASRVITRSVQKREEDAPVRTYTGGDMGVTCAPTSAAWGWQDRLPDALPGCKAKLVANGHRYGDLVLIETPEGERVELAQNYARPTDSLVRRPTPTQLRVINALVSVGLVLARF